MIRRILCLAAIGGLAAGIAAADAPSSSLRPVLRPAPAGASVPSVTATMGVMREQVTASGVHVTIGAQIRPMPRARVVPAAFGTVQPPRPIIPVQYDADVRPAPRPQHPLAGFDVVPASARSAAATPGAPHPKARPAFFGKLFGKRDGGNSASGAICGVNAIKGTAIKSIGNPSGGCGISNPVRVTEVSGVRLSQHATIDCTTAKALNTWVNEGIKPAIGRRGGGVEELHVVAHYACRTRNNRPGGKLSEHAKGHAVDVAGIRLKDGTELAVQKDWRSRKWSKTMRRIHGSACGPFGTVLGPNADRYHQDHFHVDTARYRSGPYCR